jgi:hypothetical protein
MQTASPPTMRISESVWSYQSAPSEASRPSLLTSSVSSCSSHRRVLCPAQWHCSIYENVSWSKRLTPHILMNKLSERRAPCLHSGASPNIQTAVGLALPHNLQIVLCTLLSQASLLSNPGAPTRETKKSTQTNKPPRSGAHKQFLQLQLHSSTCQHAVLPRCTGMQYSHRAAALSACPHIACQNLPNLLHSHYIPEGPYWIWQVVATSSRDSAVHRATLRVHEPRFQFSRFQNAQSGCGTTHKEPTVIVPLGTGMQTGNGEQQRNEQRNGLQAAQLTVRYSAPQTSTLVKTPNGLR